MKSLTVCLQRWEQQPLSGWRLPTNKMITKVTEESQNTHLRGEGGLEAEEKLLGSMEAANTTSGQPPGTSRTSRTSTILQDEESATTSKCTNKKWPLLFERASSAWWHPQFDSPILEQQYWRSLSPRTIKRIQFGLFYLLLLSTTLAIYAFFLLDSWITYLVLAGGKSSEFFN